MTFEMPRLVGLQIDRWFLFETKFGEVLGIALDQWMKLKTMRIFVLASSNRLPIASHIS